MGEIEKRNKVYLKYKQRRIFVHCLKKEVFLEIEKQLNDLFSRFFTSKVIDLRLYSMKLIIQHDKEVEDLYEKYLNSMTVNIRQQNILVEGQC